MSADAITELQTGSSLINEAMVELVRWTDVVVSHALPTSVRARLACITSKFLRCTKQITTASAVIVDAFQYFEKPWAVRDVEMASVRSELARRAAAAATIQQQLDTVRVAEQERREKRVLQRWKSFVSNTLGNHRHFVKEEALRERIRQLKQSYSRQKLEGPVYGPTLQLPTPVPTAHPVGDRTMAPPMYPTDLLPPSHTAFSRQEVAEMKLLHAKQMHFIGTGGDLLPPPPPPPLSARSGGLGLATSLQAERKRGIFEKKRSELLSSSARSQEASMAAMRRSGFL